ncbi:MAG TPA: zinc ribbon domain-containing protein [Pyrinomonadaceae bacterium]|nr:zinc ribbon domain-containing protein [Pyrinomonadaceae bacterium]
MFCPKCAAQNLDGASYCRVCGANISLVPQALSGQLSAPSEEGLSRSERRARRRHKEVAIEAAFRNVFMGLAFLFVALALFFTRAGIGWWFWMLIPAFGLMGSGLAQYVRYREEQKHKVITPGSYQPPIVAPSAPPNSFPTRNTGELVSQPPSVSEGTTRHLGTEAPTRVLDASAQPPKQ